MKEIKIEGETIYLKKESGGYRVVYPIKINGKINWFNLIAGGSWFNLIKLGLIISVLLIIISEYSTAVKLLNECLNKPNLLFP